jgi:hypothetical protein
MGSLTAYWQKHTAPDQVLHADVNLWHLLHVPNNIAGFRPRCHRVMADGMYKFVFLDATYLTEQMHLQFLTDGHKCVMVFLFLQQIALEVPAFQTAPSAAQPSHHLAAHVLEIALLARW